LSFHHTFTHILGPHGSFCGIPALQGSLSSETPVYGPQRSTPSFLHKKFHQCTFALV
jgi:hypothetical protein